MDNLFSFIADRFDSGEADRKQRGREGCDTQQKLETNQGCCGHVACAVTIWLPGRSNNIFCCWTGDNEKTKGYLH